MSITRKEVEQIARLARLALAEEELDTISHDLGSILQHMQELDRVPLEGVAPMEGAIEEPAPMRPDAVGADPLDRAIEDFAPAWSEGFFVVPRLAALDADALVAEEDAS